MTDHAPSITSSSKGTEVKTHNQYKNPGLSLDSLLSDPLSQFEIWFQEASSHVNIPEPESMTLSTTSVGPPPRPSSRVVLLKKVDEQGFLFFSNYHSRKGKELEANPYAALTFYWNPLHKSVRVSGRVEKLTKAESQAYFDGRPLGSRLGAHASPQSKVIGSREELEKNVRAIENSFDAKGAAGLDGEGVEKAVGNRKVPVPDYWGGYRVIPDEVEFWVGRQNRLHDRLRYTRSVESQVNAKEDKWTVDRLAP